MELGENSDMSIVENEISALRILEEDIAVHEKMFSASIKNILHHGNTNNNKLLYRAQQIGADKVYSILQFTTREFATSLPFKVDDVVNVPSKCELLNYIHHSIKEMETKAREIATVLVDFDIREPRRSGRNSFFVTMQEYCNAILTTDFKICIDASLRTLLDRALKDGDINALDVIKKYLLLPYKNKSRSCVIDEKNDVALLMQMRNILESRKYRISYTDDTFGGPEEVKPQPDLEFGINLPWANAKTNVVFRYDNIRSGLLHQMFRHDLVFDFETDISTISSYCIKLRRSIFKYGECRYEKFENYWRSRCSYPDHKLLVEYQSRLANWIMTELRQRKFKRISEVNKRKTVYIFEYEKQYLLIFFYTNTRSCKLYFLTAYIVSDISNFK